MLLHPSNFSPGSEAAFAHALKLALEARLELKLLHVEKDGIELDWSQFPGVRDTCERWGVIPRGSTEEELSKAGLKIEKVISVHKDPVVSIRHYLNKHDIDLIILATHQRQGISRWLEKSVAEPAVRETLTPTLFVPERGRRFVDPESGKVRLRHILVPVDTYPHPQPALDAAAIIVRFLDCRDVAVKAIHVGDAKNLPSIRISLPEEADRWRLETLAVPGDVVDRVVGTAGEWLADLIVMSTAGHHGFLDALRGSTTERILRRAPCPVLAIPHEGAL